MKHLILAAFLFVSTFAFSQDRDYRLSLVDKRDNLSLRKTIQTYDIIIVDSTVYLYSPALQISFGMPILNDTGTGNSYANIVFGEDTITCPIRYYEEYPRYLVIIFKPENAPETRYWISWAHFQTRSPYDNY